MENKLQQVNEQAALFASNALSKLIKRPVKVEISKAEVKKPENLSPFIGREEMVAGIYLPVTGDIEGSALFAFPKETAFVLSDLLLQRAPGKAGKARTLNELDVSALKEVGNIISGNYLTVLADVLDVKMIEHIPNFSFDMSGAIVSQIIAAFTQKSEEALVIEIQFSFKPEILKGYFLLLFDAEQFRATLDSLAGVEVGAQRPF